jgi:hypothetical protein
MACPARPRPLKVLDNFQGWGNRIGWWQTVAALGEALGAPAVYTGWHGAPRWHGGRSYDYYEVRRLVRLPRVMRYLEDVVAANQSALTDGGRIAPPLSGTAFRVAFRALDADEIPLHPRPYVNDYIAEPAWEMVRSWGRRGFFAMPPCLTREAFLRTFRRIGAQLRPSIAAARCLPPRGSFIALHVRRGDKAAAIQKDVAAASAGRTSALKRAHTKTRSGSADLFVENRTWAALSYIGRASPGMQWVVVSDSAKARREAAQRLVQSGLRVLPATCTPRPLDANRPHANATVVLHGTHSARPLHCSRALFS